MKGSFNIRISTPRTPAGELPVDRIQAILSRFEGRFTPGVNRHYVVTLERLEASARGEILGALLEVIFDQVDTSLAVECTKGKFISDLTATVERWNERNFQASLNIHC